MESIFVIKKSKLVKMESKNKQKKLRLLPRYFKIIGLCVMFLAFAPALVIISNHIKLAHTQEEFLRLFTKGTFFLGLVFFAWSKDKFEDEMTFAIRLRAMVYGFFMAVFYVILIPLINIIFGNIMLGVSHNSVTGSQVIFMMLICYLLMYYFEKRNR